MNIRLALIFWAVLVAIAVANDFFGRGVVARAAGDYLSHLYRVFFIITVIFIASGIYLRMYPQENIYGVALGTGLLWLTLSLIFELGVTHYVFRMPWDKILPEYSIAQGRLWTLVLASEVAMPLLNAYLITKR